MKKLTYNGAGKLEVPGHFTLDTGQSETLSDKLAETLVTANPGLDITVEDAPDKGDESDKD